MSATTTIRISLPEKLAERLDEVARRTERDREAVAADAIEAFLEEDSWHAEAIAEAIAEADSGGLFVPHEQVDRWLAGWGTDEETAAPEPTIRR
jgi:predicted transcriptional regulator